MDDPAIELYKLEYEKGAERYQEIYKSVWANFNYLVLLAGGILAFSSNLKVLSTEWTIVLAVSPLLYWYLAVFTPGNRYGDKVVERLCQVEKILNEIYAVELLAPLSSPPITSPPITSPPTPSSSRVCSLKEQDWGLKHFTGYHERERGGFARLIEALEAELPAVRVTTFLAMVGILVVAIVGVFSISGSRDKGKVITVEQNPKALEVKVAGADAEQVQQELEKLRALIDAMSGQLKRIEDGQRQPSLLQSPSPPAQPNVNANQSSPTTQHNRNANQ